MLRKKNQGGAVMSKKFFFKLNFFALIFAVAVLTFSASALASQFEYEYLVKIFGKSFSEKRLIAEMINARYPGLPEDILNIIESKYSALPLRIPSIANSCFKDGAKGKLKLIRSAFASLKTDYDGALQAFIKDFAENILKPNPALIDDLIAKKGEMKSLASKHETLAKTLLESKDEIKALVEARHASVKDEIKNAAVTNFKKINPEILKKAAGDFKNFRDNNPQLIECAGKLKNKFPDMKKPGIIVISLLKNPETLVKLTEIIGSGYKNEICSFIEGFLDTLIENGGGDFFSLRADIADLLNKKNPGVLFKAAKFKLEAKRNMAAFIKEKYPQLPEKISGLLDKHFGAFFQKITQIINKEQPELIKSVLTKVRSEFGGLEKDIDLLLKEKYPSLLSDIESGTAK